MSFRLLTELYSFLHVTTKKINVKKLTTMFPSPYGVIFILTPYSASCLITED